MASETGTGVAARRTLPNESLWGELYPFEPHFAALGSGRIHYVDVGPDSPPDSSEPTLLFVHGNPTWSFHWRGLIQACRDQSRCVAPDHLGCGFSDLQPRPLRLADHVDQLTRLIERLDLQRVTLVAQDWGGAIGLGAVLRNADRFERLVLFNTGAFPPWYIPWRIRACRLPGLGRFAVQGLNAFSRAASTMTLARRGRLDPRVAAAYLAPYDSWQRRAAVFQFVRDIPDSPAHLTWQVLEQIQRELGRLSSLPKLLVWGMRDWCFRPDCLERFSEIWPEAEVQQLSDVGHWVVEDAPQECESLVLEFLSRTAAPVSGVVSQ